VNETPPHRYAVRRLNPVQGVVQVVAIEGARALSHDGRVWEIQILAERPEHTWGSLNQGGGTKQFFRFGNWQPQQGISRVPANPVLDIGGMQAASEALITALESSQAALPFAQEDHCECWLLDHGRQPLALLASTTATALLPDIRPGSWCATLTTDHSFVSSTQLERNIANNDGHNPRRHAHELESLVRKTASGERRWFHFDDKGHRQALDPDGPAIDAAALPTLGLREDWPEDWQQALVQDYLDWLSPQLLTWNCLGPDDRVRLEQAACRHALALDAAYPLYPEVINQSLLDSARVEARLRRSTGPG